MYSLTPNLDCLLAEVSSTDELELNVFKSCNSSFIHTLLLARVGRLLQWPICNYGLKMQREYIKINIRSDEDTCLRKYGI